MTYEEQLQLEAAMSQVVTDGAQMVINADLDKKQRKWASEEAEKAWQRSVEMYNLQNEYNAPENQMGRLKAAGLNPHLMYGQGTVGNTATSTPQYHPAEGRWRDREINNPLPVAMATMSSKLQQDNFKVQNDILKEEADLKRIAAVNGVMDLLTDYGNFDYSALPEKFWETIQSEWRIGEDSYKGLKDYQLDASKADLAIKKQKLTNMVIEGGLKENLSKIANEKLNAILKNGYDVIGKDNYSDKALKELMGSGEGGAVVKNILPLALRLIGK